MIDLNKQIQSTKQKYREIFLKSSDAIKSRVQEVKPDGFEGDIFIKLEKLKQKVRKLKEEIIYYNTILPEDKSVQRIIDRHQSFIDKYKMYGSEDW